MTDNEYMARAIALAKRAAGFTSPNPLVGAVIVKDDRIIGEGYHHRYGDLHAERDALKNCSEDPKGATIYVTLEPCCHHGKQPPCTDAIIEAGISKVVCGSGDPNPLVAGKGLEILRDHGIEVVEGCMQEECLGMNDIFFYYIQNQKPYVLMKYAMTLDGKIASHTGKSQWISGEESRTYVHRERHLYSAIMVGVGTVLADDPMLNCRIEGLTSPIRIVCDSGLGTPLSAKIVQTAKEYSTIIATCVTDEGKLAPYRECGCEIITTPASSDGKVELNLLMEELGRRKIDSLLLEGGGELNWSMLKAGLVNKVQAFVSPMIMGGHTAKGPVGGTGFDCPDEAVRLANMKLTRIGEDFMIEGEVDGCLPE